MYDVVLSRDQIILIVNKSTFMAIYKIKRLPLNLTTIIELWKGSGYDTRKKRKRFRYNSLGTFCMVLN